MSSRGHGTNILDVEITNISMHGFWILIRGREYFLPFNDFPWFREQSVSSITHVMEISPGHLYWPDLDIDLSLEIIEHPERFPLISRSIKLKVDEKRVA